MKEKTMSHVKNIVGGLILLALILLSIACISPQNPDPGTKIHAWNSIANSIALMWGSIMLVGITTIIGFVWLIFKVVKLYHVRIMAMIEKGIYQYQPANWPLILLCIGIVAIFISVPVSILVYLENDILVAVAIGLLLIMGGTGILVFRKLLEKDISHRPKENK
jgi:hypothetical protein